jgi:phosphopentomutase
LKGALVREVMRVFLIVLDSVGIGEAPDADQYGDVGANTLANLASVAGPLVLPTLQELGLGCIPALLPQGRSICGLDAVPQPLASYGAMQERSQGKDTTVGHWEIAGIEMKEGFRVFPSEFPSFPLSLVHRFEVATGRSVIGNYAASGTEIIAELGERQLQEGCWIVYTSADSVFQIAAHEDVIPLDELYRACEVARRLCDEYRIGRVIARPFLGAPGAFHRTENRRDFSYAPPEPTILDELTKHSVEVTTIGKLDDVFCNRGISRTIHVENNRDAEEAILELARSDRGGLAFGNLIDFDMLYGHRRDPVGYAQALSEADDFLGELISAMQPDDVLIVTADHGTDPTFHGTDHTREYVPLLVYGKDLPARNLGIRAGFYDVAQTVAKLFTIPPMPRGRSFL